MPGTFSPFDFTDENIEAVLARTENGENLTDIMASYRSSHARWLDRCEIDPDLAARYAKARRHHADAYAEGAIRILEQEPGYTTVLNSKNEVISERIDTGYVAWQKARFDGRLKLLSFWHKERYGDQRGVEVSTPPGRPLQVEDKRDPATMALAIAAALRAKKRDGDPPEITDADIDDLV